MKTYYVTFYSHFSAIAFSKTYTADSVTLMPVPRALSSSCGTCAKLVINHEYTDFTHDGIEAVYLYEDESYHPIYQA